MAVRKERNATQMGRIKEQAKKSGANVSFAEIGNGDPRNAVISTGKEDAMSGENEVGLPDREV